MGRKRKYNTEEEMLAAKRERIKKQRETPLGRARHLIDNYRRLDKKYNRGECTLTAQWIVDNIFSKPCAHCGETDWHKLGCNRLNNSLPHATNNVETCCKKCNDMIASYEKRKTVYQYTLDGKLVKIWESLFDCNKNGFDCGNVSKCCYGQCKKHKGYKWSFNPL